MKYFWNALTCLVAFADRTGRGRQTRCQASQLSGLSSRARFAQRYAVCGLPPTLRRVQIRTARKLKSVSTPSAGASLQTRSPDFKPSSTQRSSSPAWSGCIRGRNQRPDIIDTSFAVAQFDQQRGKRVQLMQPVRRRIIGDISVFGGRDQNGWFDSRIGHFHSAPKETTAHPFGRAAVPR